MKTFPINSTGLILGLCVLLLIAGCAAKPESIAPAYVSEMSYADWKCKSLGEEQQRVVNALATASDAQRVARNNDIAGVILIGLPVSSLSGSNQAAQISRLKGELEAIQRTGVKKGCNLPEVQIVDPKTEGSKPGSASVH